MTSIPSLLAETKAISDPEKKADKIRVTIIMMMVDIMMQIYIKQSKYF